MSDPETALCCMIVSNPTGGERPHAWQKRVNDHMRAQAAEIARLTAELAEAGKTVDRWQNLSRDTFEAMCSMRNAINEHIPMPSLESDLLQGPENSVFCAEVAGAVVGTVMALRSQRAEVLREAAAAIDADGEYVRAIGLSKRILALIDAPKEHG